MNAIVSAADILAQSAQARGSGNSQATVVEQSRAIAEVQGALVVAQNRPRDRAKALNEALESCRTSEVAEGAFFKFSRGGQSVAGESIHLARELARCWGNILHAVIELERDDNRGISEMMAYAWDLETNTRSQLSFIVPHIRDTKSGPKKLAETRDIYENNANMGARRLRECIFAVLPPYLVKSAAEQCRATLESGEDEVPLVQRIAAAIAEFEKIGISKDRIEAKLGPITGFTAVDIANLQISYKSIRRNEITADEEFPRVAIEDTAAEIRKTKPANATAPQSAEIAPPVSAAEPAGDPITDAEQDEAASYQPGRDDTEMGEAHTTADAEADIIAHIGRKVRISDVNGIINSRIGELDEDGQDRVRSVAMDRIAEIRAAEKVDG